MFAVSSHTMKRLDQFMIETLKIPDLVLMENAAKAASDQIRKKYPINEESPIREVILFCGTGNNGGDGLAIARWLSSWGYSCKLYLVGNQDKCTTATRYQYEIIGHMNEHGSNIAIEWIEDSASIASLEKSINVRNIIIVDAMIGTGCSKPLRSPMDKVVDIINRSDREVIAIDVPTGINSDNGQVMGIAIQASMTVCLAYTKLGLVLYPGADYTGQLIVEDIGITEQGLTSDRAKIELLDATTLKQAFQSGIFERKKDTHKHSFGTLGIIAGDSSMLGASLMAAKAAYRSGVGLVKIFVEKGYEQIFVQALPEAIVTTYTFEQRNLGQLEEDLNAFAMMVDVIALGPGFGQSLKAQKTVQWALNQPMKIVMDADALNILSMHEDWLLQRKAMLLLTPHVGEMARLIGMPGKDVSKDLVAIGRDYAMKYRLYLALKSARTLIASPSGRCHLNVAGNPGMATAGSGDVLTGIVGGLFAQGFQPEEALVYGVLLHACAGDNYQKDRPAQSLIARDIIKYMWKGL